MESPDREKPVNSPENRIAKAQMALASVIGLVTATALIVVAIALAVSGDIFMAMPLLLLLPAVVPSTVALGFLLNGHRRPACYAAWIGTLLNALILVGCIPPLASYVSTGHLAGMAACGLWGLQAAYATATLARVSFDLRVTPGERRTAAQLRAAHRPAALPGSCTD